MREAGGRGVERGGRGKGMSVCVCTRMLNEQPGNEANILHGLTRSILHVEHSDREHGLSHSLPTCTSHGLVTCTSHDSQC